MFLWDDDDLNDEQVAAIHEPNNVFLIACPAEVVKPGHSLKIAFELSKFKGS